MKKLMLLTAFLGTIITLMLAQTATTSTSQTLPKAAVEMKKDSIEPVHAIGRGTPKKGQTAAPPPRMDGIRDTTRH